MATGRGTPTPRGRWGHQLPPTACGEQSRSDPRALAKFLPDPLLTAPLPRPWPRERTARRHCWVRAHAREPRPARRRRLPPGYPMRVSIADQQRLLQQGAASAPKLAPPAGGRAAWVMSINAPLGRRRDEGRPRGGGLHRRRGRVSDDRPIRGSVRAPLRWLQALRRVGAVTRRLNRGVAVFTSDVRGEQTQFEFLTPFGPSTLPLWMSAQKWEADLAAAATTSALHGTSIKVPADAPTSRSQS